MSAPRTAEAVIAAAEQFVDALPKVGVQWQDRLGENARRLVEAVLEHKQATGGDR
jgi:hypothetical protein